MRTEDGTCWQMVPKVQKFEQIAEKDQKVVWEDLLDILDISANFALQVCTTIQKVTFIIFVLRKIMLTVLFSIQVNLKKYFLSWSV